MKSKVVAVSETNWLTYVATRKSASATAFHLAGF